MIPPEDGTPPQKRGRRKIRVVREKTNTRVATVSLLGASLAAALVFFIWYSLRGAEPQPPYVRTLSEVWLSWKCPDGHRFRAWGQAGSHPCVHCRKPACVVDEYLCDSHGVIEVLKRFDEEWSPTNRVFSLRLAEGEWVSSQEGLRCPKCRRPLHKAPKDPLGRIITP